MTSHRVPAAQEPNAWTERLAAVTAAGRPPLDLASGDPTRAGLSPLPEAARAMAAAGVSAYEPDPRGAPAAREAVARMLSARAGEGGAVEAGDVVLVASTSEAYAHLFRLLADPGGTVLAPAPSYPLFAPLAHAEGLALGTYPLRYDGAWHLERGAFAAAAQAACAVITVEPNNPTGSCLDADDRRFVRGIALERGLAVISDEVFGDHPRDAARALPSWLGEREVPCFVLGGLSKLCGLPQLKLAWIASRGPQPARAKALAGLEWLADLFLSVGAPVQSALPELLALRHAFAARVRERVSANLAALESLARAHPEVAILPSAGGWSAVLRVSAARTDEAWALALLERGVAVHPGQFYDFEAGEHLVASLIVEPATFAAGLDVLDEVLAAP